jgi:hypothetical protein
MKRKYMLLINDEQAGTVCWKGEGTVGQVKGDIEELVGKKGIEPEMLEVIPVIGSRLDPWKIGAAILGLGLIGSVIIYENLRKRVRERRREHPST